jgi:hypothetical protein
VGAVVLFEADQVLHLELALEVGHVAHIRTAKGVDALVVVADAEQRRTAAGEQLQPAVLQLVGVLEFVHQDVAEALLIVAAQRFVALQQFVGTQQQLGEIDHAFALALRFVGFVEPDAFARPIIRVPKCGLDRGGAQPLFLLRVDEMAQFARREFFVIDIQRFQKALDGSLLVGRIEDLEQLRQAGIAVMGTQQAVAQAVKGADPHAPDVDRQYRGEPRLHFLGGLVGEGHGEHAGRRDLAVGNQPSDARRQHPRLARTGAGEDQGMRRRQGDGGKLRGVEAIEQGIHEQRPETGGRLYGFDLRQSA